MHRPFVTALPALLLAALPLAPAVAAPLPFVHVQTDKPSYRLGETVWFRVHRGPEAAGLALKLALRGPSGAAVATAELRAGGADDAGAFPLDLEWAGGAYRIEATGPTGALLHAAPLELFDVAIPQLDLSLRVLEDVHYPGDAVIAAFRARDLDGGPLAGRELRWRATFGELVTSGTAGPTDGEGRAVVRVPIPEEARAGGHLAVGLELGRGRSAKRAAVAAPVVVSSSVGWLDAFPEGGAILPGEQRLGLLLRDGQGRPTACEGRVLDETGACVATFRADRAGRAAVLVDYAAGRRYTVRIDRPAGVRRTFPLPGPTGHPVALRLERVERSLRVHVRGQAGRAEVHLLRARGAESSEVRLREEGEATATFPAGEELEVAHVVVVREGRAYARAAVLLGERWPLTLRLVRVEGDAVPGGEVTLDLEVDRGAAAVPAELGLAVFHSGAAAGASALASDLAARALLQPHVDGLVAGGGDLFAEGAEARARRDALLLVRAAYAYPPEGLPLTDALAGPLQGVAVARRAPQATVVMFGAKVGEPKTRARATALDRLLERAPYTRATLPRQVRAARFERIASAQARLAAPDLGAGAKRLPQEVRVPARAFDARDTLAWAPRLDASAGSGRLRLRLGHQATDLVVVAQGLANVGGRMLPVVGTARLEPRGTFHTELKVPRHAHVGDRLELYATVSGDERLTLEVAATPGLEPEGRTRVEVDPRRSARTHKFVFWARTAAEHTRLRVVTTGGGFREVQDHALVVRPSAVVAVQGVSGLGAGAQASFSIPAGATPGSVRARASVTSWPVIGGATAGVESLLVQPYGCFEQTTSTNYPNLVVLSCLLERGADAAVLERAHELAEVGFRRVLTFQHPSGGFGLFPGEEPTPAYTAMGVVQLAHYGRLFQGRGALELQRALDWLDDRQVSGLEATFAALGAEEAGLCWAGAARGLRLEPRTAYERAVLANCVAAWQSPWPTDLPAREQLLRELVEALRAARDPDSGAISSEGRGLMASWQHQLTVETTALAGVAFAAAGEREAARDALSALCAMRHPTGGWDGTQSTAQAVRALTRLADPPPSRAPVLVTLETSEGPARGLIEPTRDRPLTVTRPLALQPGKSVSLRLAVQGADEVDYQLACSYELARPASSPEAPYALTTSLPAQVHVGEAVSVGVEITPAARPVAGQVTAVVPFPAGLELADGVEKALEPAGVTHHVLRDGRLELYWATPPARPLHLRLPARAVVAGHFGAAPASIYPYYCAEQVAYAPGLELKVLAGQGLLDLYRGR